jgi:hypothetical protein
MIHLDTFGISFIAKDKRLQEFFFRFLENTGESLLLNSFQLMELMKSSKDDFKTQLCDFFQFMPKKRLLSLGIVEVIYQEIASMYCHDRILTPDEFQNQYTIELPPSESIDTLLKGAEKNWSETCEMQQGWVGGVLFGKFVSTKKVPSAGKLKVKDFLNKLNPSMSCSLFKRGEAIAAFDRHAPVPGDMIAFSEYMYQVNRVDRSRGIDLIAWIQESIQRFHFPKAILDWKARKFLEQDYFLRIAGHALEKMPDGKVSPEAFYKKLNMLDLKEFPSFFIVHKVADYLKNRPQKQKASDYFDILYIALLPYVSLFLCDGEVNSAITQILKSNRKMSNFGNCIWPEFLRKITDEQSV